MVRPGRTASHTSYIKRRIASPLAARPVGPKRHVQEVERNVPYPDVLTHSDSELTGEIGSGTYKLLFRILASHREEAQGFYDTTIPPMVRYDDQYRTELVRTLQAYLDANCNMNATASAIYPHRHTVAYRLDRIRELTGLDPTLSEDRERLRLGLKLHRIIAAQPPPQTSASPSSASSSTR